MPWLFIAALAAVVAKEVDMPDWLSDSLKVVSLGAGAVHGNIEARKRWEKLNG